MHDEPSDARRLGLKLGKRLETYILTEQLSAEHGLSPAADPVEVLSGAADYLRYAVKRRTTSGPLPDDADDEDILRSN